MLNYGTAENLYATIPLDNIVIKNGDKLIVEYKLQGAEEVSL